MKRVTPPEAKQLLDDGWAYLDVRSIPEFAQGHVPGAFNVPIAHFAGGRMQPNAEFVDVVRKAFPTDAKLVVGCKSGARSMRAADLLEQCGYENLIEMRGGFGGEFEMTGRCVVPGWADAGLPVSTAPEAGRTYEELRSK